MGGRGLSDRAQLSSGSSFPGVVSRIPRPPPTRLVERPIPPAARESSEVSPARSSGALEVSKRSAARSTGAPNLSKRSAARSTGALNLSKRSPGGRRGLFKRSKRSPGRAMGLSKRSKRSAARSRGVPKRSKRSAARSRGGPKTEQTLRGEGDGGSQNGANAPRRGRRRARIRATASRRVRVPKILHDLCNTLHTRRLGPANEGLSCVGLARALRRAWFASFGSSHALSSLSCRCVARGAHTTGRTTRAVTQALSRRCAQVLLGSATESPLERHTCVLRSTLRSRRARGFRASRVSASVPQRGGPSRECAFRGSVSRRKSERSSAREPAGSRWARTQ